MNNDENTIIGTAEEQKQEEALKQEETKKQTIAGGWQQVTIGGVTGILMGAAGMYAANAFAGEQPQQSETSQSTNATGTNSHTAANGLRVAEVDQNLSFGRAFAAARAEVGPGGVFHWHGNIYNTYTAEEWNSMTPAEHSHFAQQVRPEIQPGEGRPHRATAHHHHDDIAAKQETDRQEPAKQEPAKQEPTKQEQEQIANDHKPQERGSVPVSKPSDDEPEVHFLGVERVETDHGAMNVGHMVIGQQDVALIDVDDNQVFDVMAADRNNNGKLEENEVVDISARQLTVTDFAVASAQQQNGDATAQTELASQTSQDHIADDMPDYMNDADVQTV